MSSIVVRKANKEDIKEYHNIIVERCKWFKEKNIFQWDDDYPIRFNINYFNDCLNNSEIFLAIDNDKIIGGILIRDKDIYYNRVGSAFYIHHLVTKVGTHKVGDILINFAYNYCKVNNKEYLRLDAISTNKELNNYYLSNGFIYIDTQKKKNHYYNLYEKVIK